MWRVCGRAPGPCMKMVKNVRPGSSLLSPSHCTISLSLSPSLLFSPHPHSSPNSLLLSLPSPSLPFSSRSHPHEANCPLVNAIRTRDPCQRSFRSLLSPLPSRGTSCTCKALFAGPSNQVAIEHNGLGQLVCPAERRGLGENERSSSLAVLYLYQLKWTGGVVVKGAGWRGCGGGGGVGYPLSHLSLL